MIICMGKTCRATFFVIPRMSCAAFRVVFVIPGFKGGQKRGINPGREKRFGVNLTKNLREKLLEVGGWVEIC